MATTTISLDDTTLDRILDELTERAGHPRNSSALGLARWDLKAALVKYGYGFSSDAIPPGRAFSDPTFPEHDH